MGRKLKYLIIFVGVLLILNLTYGQQAINGSRYILGYWDASGARWTKPFLTSATQPATCALGEVMFDTDATAGQNIYLCTATDTWTQVTGGGGTGTPGGAVGNVQYNDGSSGFAGEAALTYDATTNILTSGKVTISDTCTLGAVTPLAAGTLCFGGATDGMLVSDGANWWTSNWSQNTSGEVWYSGANYNPTSTTGFAFATNILTVPTIKPTTSIRGTVANVINLDPDSDGTMEVNFDASGNFSGLAGTATALAANGANCSAGQAPLGVDASGAVEGCWTPTAGDVTDVFGCASGDCNDISVADGEQLDFSEVNNSATTEGLILPQATSVLTGTATGQVGYDTNGNSLYVGGSFNGLALAVPVDVQGPEYVNLFSDMLGLTVATALTPFSMMEGTAAVVASTDANPQTTSSAIGTIRIPTGTTAGNEASMGIGFNANTTQQYFEPRKLRLFGARGYSESQAAQATRKLAVGGMRTTSDGNPATKGDGIYFWCDPASDLDNDGTVGDSDTDGTGTTYPDGDCADAGDDADDCKWYAVTMNNATDNAKISTATNTTATKTTVDCSNVTTFQTLEIAYDATNVAFYINGASVATIGTNIPSDGQRLWNWGVYVDQNIAASKSWTVDWMRYYGIR